MKSIFAITLMSILGLSGLSFVSKKENGDPIKPKKATATKKAANAIPPVDKTYHIIIDKSDYELRVYDSLGWYATYPIVFGSKDQGDKMFEGDKRTPNGTFRIVLKKINPRWGFQMTLDYPTQESFQRFNQRKASGSIPKSARIGNGIAIHSTRQSEEWTVDEYYNWTDGCISVKYSEMEDLYSYIPVGTEVTIQP